MKLSELFDLLDEGVKFQTADVNGVLYAAPLGTELPPPSGAWVPVEIDMTDDCSGCTTCRQCKCICGEELR